MNLALNGSARENSRKAGKTVSMTQPSWLRHPAKGKISSRVGCPTPASLLNTRPPPGRFPRQLVRRLVSRPGSWFGMSASAGIKGGGLEGKADPIKPEEPRSAFERRWQCGFLDFEAAIFLFPWELLSLKFVIIITSFAATKKGPRETLLVHRALQCLFMSILSS